MIEKPSQMDFSEKKFFCIIAGVPGIGKTTLALSAPKPLLIDADKGLARVSARYRTDAIIPQTIDDIKKDLEENDLSAYETIVLDTGGALFEMLKPDIVRANPKASQSDGTLSLKGYGIAKGKFRDFVSYLRGFDKNLVIVFHASEVVVNEELKLTGLRIRIEGGSRDEVWDGADFGGFLEMRGSKRTIGFSNCERYYAKGTHGIHGIYEVPDLDKGGKNAFLTNLFQKARNELEAEKKDAEEYAKAMEAKPKITIAESLDQLNEAYSLVKTTKHALTSKEELWFALNEKAKALGAKYDKQQDAFADNSEPS